MTRALAFVLGGLVVYIATYAAQQLLVHAELTATELLGVETYDHLR